MLHDLHHAAPECDPWFARVVARLREDGDHEFALLLGDLTDTAKPGSFAAVKEALAKAGLKPEHAEVTMKASAEAQLAGDDGVKMQKLLDALEALDDVQDVYTTAVITD